MHTATISHIPLETREEQQSDPLAAATQAVDELRSAAEQHRTQLDQRIATELRTRDDRIAALETRLNRPGGQQGQRDEGEEEMRSFLDFARTGNMSDEQRSLNAGTAASGGYTVPENFVAELIRNVTLFSPIRQYARVMSIAGQSAKLPVRTGAMGAAWVDEDDDSTATEPTFGQVELTPFEARAFIDVSNALLEDSALDLASELARDAGEAFGALEGVSFVKGTGVGQPKGVMAEAGIVTLKSGAAATLGTDPADMLIDVFYALAAPYRGNATWGMNANTLATIRKLKDTTGQYIWQPGLQAGQPDLILGRPVVEMPDMDDVGANKLPIILGDFSNYRIVDRVALAFLRDQFSVAVKSQTRFHMRRRVGAGVTKAEAFRIIKCAA